MPNTRQNIPSEHLQPVSISRQSGSYYPQDVTLLLDIVDKAEVNNVPVTQKEALIQSGKQHYSDMLTLEQAPSPAHERIYQRALAQGQDKMAIDISRLSQTLHDIFVGVDNRAKSKLEIKNHQNYPIVSDTAPLILVSLVRAGLPIGVLLQRALSDHKAPYHLPSYHYGVSIIRDRGLDPVAMHQILSNHPDSPVVFVDGWTGKGAIYGELTRSLAVYNDTNHPHFSNIFHQGAGVIPLLTLADPAGVAWLSASGDDWLIPSGIMGSTISGLISRTLYAKPSEDLSVGLHKSVIHDELIPNDHSVAFVEHIDSIRRQLSQQPLESDATTNPTVEQESGHLPTYDSPRYLTQNIIENLASRFDITNINRIKPTIAEATRAVMRRDPEKVLLASANHPDTALLRHLCDQKKITIDVIGDEILPYQAVTIINKR